MIIVKISEGLGNQMFQYAFGYALSKKNDDVLKLDISGYKTSTLRQYELGSFSIFAERIASKREWKSLKYQHEGIFRRIGRKMRKKPLAFANTYIKESHFQFEEAVYEINDSVYLDGYWQSEKYFQEYRSDLLRQFTIKGAIHSESFAYVEKVNDMESISLHVRRGDYVADAHINSIHGNCELEYYCEAVSVMKAKVKNPHFFVFSDDLSWAKKHLNFINSTTFVELGKDVPDYEELYLMSQCKHNIIANSSFSWWGAWLNQNHDRIVVAPKKWFNDPSFNTVDLIPASWICL